MCGYIISKVNNEENKCKWNEENKIIKCRK